MSMQDTRLTPTQIEAIADENGEVYKRDIIKTTFKTRTQGFWAGSGLGLLYGAMMGAMVALSTAFVVPASVGLLLGPVTGAFALAGMLAGAAIMTSVNASTGAAVGLAKVQDRKKLLNAPDDGLAETVQYRGTVQAIPQGEKTFLHRILPFNDGSPKLFNFKAALIFGGFALGAAALFIGLGGAPLLTAALLPVMSHIGATSAVAVLIAMPKVASCMALTTAALFGASFGFDGPTVAANATQFVADIFKSNKSGPALEREQSVLNAPPVAMVAAQPQVTPQEVALLHEKLNTGEKSFVQMTQQMQASPAGITNGV
jgi:hypothetical protein